MTSRAVDDELSRPLPSSPTGGNVVLRQAPGFTSVSTVQHELPCTAGTAYHTRARHPEVSRTRGIDGKGAKRCIRVNATAHACEMCSISFIRPGGLMRRRCRKRDEDTPRVAPSRPRGSHVKSPRHHTLGCRGLKRHRGRSKAYRQGVPRVAARALTCSWPASSLGVSGVHLDHPLLLARSTPPPPLSSKGPWRRPAMDQGKQSPYSAWPRCDGRTVRPRRRGCSRIPAKASELWLCVCVYLLASSLVA